MNNYNIEQLMVIINSVDNTSSVKYSVSTGKFYMTTDIMTFEGNNFNSVSEHHNTVEKAITCFYKRIQGKKLMFNNKSIETILPIIIKE